MRIGEILQTKQGATNGDLQGVIESAIPIATRQLTEISKQYSAKTEQESCKKIFNYLKNDIRYKADGNNQQVKLPSALNRTRYGDCKSFAVYTSGILSNLKIPHSLAYVSYNNNDKTPTHIYVITEKGCIIDAVYGEFNAEKKPEYKKLKKMNISLISGIGTHKKIGKHNYITGLDFIGASEGGKEWAIRNGLMPNKSDSWLFFNNKLYRDYATSKINPLAIPGRKVSRILIEKNSGGLANSMYKLMMLSKTAAKNSADYKKMRDVELQWLKKGGNPNELYESIEEGNKKTPTGAYFNKLMRMKADGYNPNPAQWIAAAISALFGKKYNQATGQITGGDMGIGTEPAATTGLVVGSGPWWATLIGGFVTTLGTALLATKTPPARGEGGFPGDTGPPSDAGSGGNGKPTTLLPILLIGGAAAAYFIFKKKK